ncbi:MAG: TerC family protein [Syntrophaceae bacterium]|nr:TerC family protein [Syntrophaceae bacterium]
MHWDWSTLFHVEWSITFLLAMLNIVFINIILSGDNAVLIAMAVRGLDKEQRKKGILFGTGAAVVLRVILTFFVALLLDIPLLKLIGGLLILWIALQLFVVGDERDETKAQSVSMAQAIKIIILADLTMSLDNVLAVAGAAGGNLFLLIFGLALSIPIVIFTSNLISALMDKYPVIVVIGAAILGRVGGGMIITDSVVEKWLHPGKFMEYGFEIFCIIAIVVAGKLIQQRKLRKLQQQPSETETADS